MTLFRFAVLTLLIDPAIPTLLCGDFNSVLDRVLDRHGSCPFDRDFTIYDGDVNENVTSK